MRLLISFITTGFAAGAMLAGGIAVAADVMAVETLQRGQIITAADIEIYPAPDENVQDIARDFVGMEVTRTVYAGQEVTSRHLTAPRLVTRNAMVTMTYNFGGLTITTSGRALDEGALGDLVEVMNAQSRQKVMAVVTGPDEVSVQ